MAHIEYAVRNNAGNSRGWVRFNNEIGVEVAKRAMAASTEFTWRLFQQNSPRERRAVAKVTLVVEPLRGFPAYSSDNIIHLNSNYIANYNGHVRSEIIGIIYHEMTHSLQWDGAGQAPTPLIEGIADFVRMKGGYSRIGWPQPGEGSQWDEGYAVTARFLDYCNGLRNGFVAELNKKMSTGYSHNFFKDLLGKNVNQLWIDYKANYGICVHY